MLPRMLPHSYCILFRLHFGFEVVLYALWMVQGEVGCREQRRSVLIIHPCPLTDRSQHAAQWASAPAYREEKKGGVRETAIG